MSDDQISLPFFAIVLLFSGLLIRYLFFSGSRPDNTRPRTYEEQIRSRELAVGRVQEIYPQIDRRSIIWDLQRNGGNIQVTLDRISTAGRLETPPITFQPPPSRNQTPPSSSPAPAAKQPEKPKQPDLITRYNLKGKIDAMPTAEEEDSKKSKGWSSNRDERQVSLQRRRDEMILAARKKMEAKLAGGKTAQGS